MFKKIKEAVPDFNPVKFTVDFELATILAIEEVFPAVKIHGCNVHFQRAIYRKAQSLGLLAHEETTLYVKLCACLAFLPKEEIEDGWLSIMANSIPDEKVIKFNDYFVEQWLEPPEMISKWCCYKERHRTTNLVEAWNQRLQCYLGHKPSLLSFLDMITTDISTYGTAQARLRRNDSSICKRKKSSVINDKIIAKLTEKYEKKTNFNYGVLGTNPSVCSNKAKM